jgi:xylulokinase
VWKETRYLTTASSYLVYKLTGEHVMDRHTASHYMPLIDIHTLEWSNRFADHVAPLALLPRLAWSDEKAGEVTREAAARTGLKAGTPVVVGAVDALSEAVSVGVTRPGDLMIMYGSTTFFILMLDKPVPDPRTWTTAGAFHGQYALAAGMATTGSLTRWFRDQFARDLAPDMGYDTLFASLEHTAPGAEGLIMLPYFSGERTPINDSKARGVVAGLTLTHTREHLFRAVLEGVAYGIRHNLDTFSAMGTPIRRVVAVGGGTKNNTWPQIVSNVAKVEQYVPERTIGASLGNAFLAGLAVDLVKHQDLPAWVGSPQRIEPDARLHSLYESGYQDYLDLYTHTKEVVHRLGKRAES